MPSTQSHTKFIPGVRMRIAQSPGAIIVPFPDPTLEISRVCDGNETVLIKAIKGGVVKSDHINSIQQTRLEIHER